MSASSGSSSDDRSESQSFPRRASFSPGSALSDLFTGRSVPPPYPGPASNAAAAAAAAQAQRGRRMSLSGLGTSPGAQTQSNFTLRRGSVSSINSTASAIDDSAAADDADGSPTSPILPNNPFARRMNFGARALRDVRIPGRVPGAANAGASSNSASSAAPAQENGKQSPPNTQSSHHHHHQRRPSVSTMPLPVSSLPARQPSYDDPLQERILKGDFYMD